MNTRFHRRDAEAAEHNLDHEIHETHEIKVLNFLPFVFFVHFVLKMNL